MILRKKKLRVMGGLYYFRVPSAYIRNGELKAKKLYDLDIEMVQK